MRVLKKNTINEKFIFSGKTSKKIQPLVLDKIGLSIRYTKN